MASFEIVSFRKLVGEQRARIVLNHKVDSNESYFLPCTVIFPPLQTQSNGVADWETMGDFIAVLIVIEHHSRLKSGNFT